MKRGELTVLMSEFLNGFFDRHLAEPLPWMRRRCTKRVDAALAALKAFAEAQSLDGGLRRGV